MHVVLLQILVEEVAEPIEFPVSDVILLESHKAKKPGPGSRANKEMPDWVNKLAEKYDMTVQSSRQCTGCPRRLHKFICRGMQ